LRLSFSSGPAAHFDEQKASAGREQTDVIDGKMLAHHEVDQSAIEALQAEGVQFKDAGDDIGRLERVVEGEDGEDAEGGRGGEVEGGGEDGCAGALGANKGASDIEAVLGKEFVEVVARDAAGDAGKALADAGGVLIAKSFEAGVDLAYAATSGDKGVELVFAGAADSETGSVVEEDVKGFDVVNDFARHEAVHAATVVADHAAEGAAAVGGGIGTVGEVVELGGFAQAVEDDAGLNYGEAGSGVERDEAIEVAGEVEDDGDVGGLTGDAGTGPAGKDGGADSSACGDSGFHIGNVAGKDDSYRKLAIVGGIGSVQGAGCKIESDFATKSGLESGFELAMGSKALMIERRLVEKLGNLGRGHGHVVSRTVDESLARRPLINDNAKVAELLHYRFNVTAELGPIGLVRAGRFGYRNDAAIVPCASGESDESLREVGGTNLKLLTASAFRAEHGSLADGAVICVGKGDAHADGIGIYREEWIAPGTGLMDVDVHALCGERNLGQLGSLLFLLAFSGLSCSGCLLFGGDGGLGHADNGLLFLVAGDKGDNEKQVQAQKSAQTGTVSHGTSITSWKRE